MSRRLSDINCTLEHETEKAVKITSDVTPDVWVPKSICEFAKDDPDVDMPCPGTITLREDLAVDKELV